MDKDRLFRKYTAFYTIQDIGSNFIGRIKGYLPDIGTTTVELAAISILINNWHWNVPTWLVIGYVIGKKYFWMVIYFVWGEIMMRTGMVKTQQEYLLKEESLNPWNREAQQTLTNIAKAVGAQSKFTHYNDENRSR